MVEGEGQGREAVGPNGGRVLLDVEIYVVGFLASLEKDLHLSFFPLPSVDVF